jgi:hypothetical protein
MINAKNFITNTTNNYLMMKVRKFLIIANLKLERFNYSVATETWNINDKHVSPDAVITFCAIQVVIYIIYILTKPKYLFQNLDQRSTSINVDREY